VTRWFATGAGTVVFLLCVVLVAADRWSWAKAARWAEDQAVPLRLAESLPWDPPRVGILNSRHDPNPNGLVWLAWPLTALSSFQMMAFALAVGQVGALVVLVASMLPAGARWPALLAVLTSMPLRFATELWPNWMLVMPFGVALAAFLAYRRAPRLLWFGVSFAAALICGALYLPGVVTLLSVVALWIAFLAARRPTGWRPLLVVAATLTLVAVAMTFGPYLTVVDVRALHPAEPRGFFKRLVLAAYEAVAGPIGTIRLGAGVPWMNTMVTPGPDFAALGTTIALAGVALWMQVGVTTMLCVRAALRGREGIRPLGGLAWVGAFVVTVCLLTPLVTGQVPSRDGREDLLVQLLPVVLVLVFGSPLLLDDHTPVARAAVRLTMGIVVVFAIASSLAGHRLGVELASPASTVITRPGQPGYVMEQVAAAITDDWADRAEGSIPIEYDTDRGVFALTGEWVAGHGAWHARPLKVGEGFDLALERTMKGLNACGPRCPGGTARYVVALGDEPAPIGSRDVWRGSGLRVWWVEP
jgi:hypothetical protein